MSYIGKAPGFGIRNRFYFTATASQTTFSGADDNGQTLAYADSKYLDVFLNGVSLVAGTDYTATTLTSITLTSGASADDIIEIIAYDIFSVADTVSSANGGTFNSSVTFDAGLKTDTISEETSATGVTIDGVLLKDNDIEATDGTFSGGVYLGGTGAANYLDDYEEGTFTPTFSSTGASFSYSAQAGYYTKTGNLVSFRLFLRGQSSGTTSGFLSIAGLPFTTSSDSGNYSAVSIGQVYFVDYPTSSNYLNFFISPNSTNIELEYSVDNTNTQPLLASSVDGTTSSGFILSGSYYTNA